MNHAAGPVAEPRLAPQRILWTMPYVPYPTTTGGKLKCYTLLRQLAARGHAVTLLCLSKEPADQQAHDHLASFLQDVIVLPRRPRASPGRLLRAALSFVRPAVATINGCDPEYSRVFNALLARNFDIVQIENSYAFEPFARPLRRHRMPFLLNEHNVESTVIAAQYARLPRWLRPLGRLDAMRARIWERRVLRRAACVTTNSPTDRAAFAAMGATAVLLPNGIDMTPFLHVERDVGAMRIAFLGNYEYDPNIDAVHWLCEAIMPQVWNAEPAARLAVYGYAMPPAWRTRWPDPRLEFPGFAPSIAQVHASSTVFVAPLRAGGGSKLKVLEAMAAGMPVVGTGQALSGLDVQDGVHALRGETAVEIAAALLRCLREPALATALGQRARALAVAGHDWESIAGALEGIYRTWLLPAARDRQQAGAPGQPPAGARGRSPAAATGGVT